MSKTIDDVISGVIQREGAAYTNNPSDKGGPTRYGITLVTLSRYRGQTVSPADVAALTEQEARAIYRSLYVTEPHFNLILDANVDIGVELVDTGANMGPPTAGKYLQRLLNVFNGRGAYYQAIEADGNVGPATANALRSFLAKRGAEGVQVLLKGLNHLQGARYVELAEYREANKDFVYGWLKERT